MKKNSVLVCLGAGMLLALAPRTDAEPAYAESIEWVLATTDRVIVGKVVAVELVADREGKDCQAVTAAVSKTLKGKHTDRETFLLPAWVFKGYGKQWIDQGIPMIFCLVKNDGKRVSIPAEKFQWVVRDNGNSPNAVLLGKSKDAWYLTGCILVLTRDFEVLTEPAAILKYVEKTLSNEPKNAVPKSHTLLVPFGTAVAQTLAPMNATFLTVPVDENLEELGVKWCKSKSPRERAEGAPILAYFKNEKNVAVLKSLLNDPSTSEATMHRSVPGKAEFQLVYRKNLYYVRQAAFDALRELKVKIDRPVLEELLEGRDDVGPKLDRPIRK